MGYRLFQVMENDPPDSEEIVASAVPEEEVMLIPVGHPQRNTAA